MTPDTPTCLLPDTATRLTRDLEVAANHLRGVVAGAWDTMSSEDRAIVGEVAANLGAWADDIAFIRTDAACVTATPERPVPAYDHVGRV